MQDLIAEFVVEAGETLEQIDSDLLRLEGHPAGAPILNGVFRLLHTIKGASGFLGLTRLQTVSHAGETLLELFRQTGGPVPPDAFEGVLAAIDRIRALLAAIGETGAEPAGDDADLIQRLERLGAGDAGPMPGPGPASVSTPETPLSNEDRRPPPAASVRVDLQLLETMMRLTSELVLSRNQLVRLHGLDRDDVYSLPLQRLSAITSELQDTVMQTRMRPIGAIWKTLPRLVRDLSRELGKEVALRLAGEDTEVDRQLLEAVRDPIQHIVRNAVDHGLEPPEDRVRAGKPRTGEIRAQATQEGNWIVIRIVDDGRGLDADRIRARAVARGLLTEAEAAQLSEAAIHDLIFAPGFSTAEAVTTVSGRGVGMDVVRANVARIGGQVEIQSVPGRGCGFVLRIPLTLAIMPALLVRAGGQRFAVAQSAVTELIRLEGPGDRRIERVGAMTLLQVREALMPLNSLSALLGLEAADPGRFAMILEHGERRFAVAVDEIIDTEEIVVKPVSAKLRDLPEYSGATLLGDGTVTLILEPGRLAGAAGDAMGRRQAPPVAAADERARREPVLFLEVGGGATAVASMVGVRRLERAPVGQILSGAAGPLMTYRGRATPIVPVCGVRLQTEGVQCLVMVGDDEACVGVAVDSVVDLDEVRLEVTAADRGPGRLGTAMIRDTPHPVLDLRHYHALGLARLTGAAADGAAGAAA